MSLDDKGHLSREALNGRLSQKSPLRRGEGATSLHVRLQG
jgi:hypothetical protein